MFDAKHAEEVFFCQTNYDEEWITNPYWDGDIRHHGCGLIGITECIDIVTDKDLTPMDVYNMRAEAGIDQHSTVVKDGMSCCGGDARPQFNEIYKRIFGIKCLLLERSVEAFIAALQNKDTAIWASSRNTPFHDINGDVFIRAENMGHIICFWKYEDGIFYAKDCHWDKELGNNVPYTEEELERWLSANSFQQYAVTAV